VAARPGLAAAADHRSPLRILNSPSGYASRAMDLGLQGRSAIVLGASQGMGLAIAEALAAEGADVAMFARRAEVVESEATRIGALAVPGDLTRAADLERLVTTTLEAFGGIDVLVLNGGGPPPGAAADVTAASVSAAVELLLVPHVRLVALCLPHLRASGRGRIIAIESTSVKEPIANLALSNAVRPGVVGWLKTLGRELGPDAITVNTIAPGRIDTERLRSLYGADGPPPELLAQIPARRVGSPAEIAAIACFLASEQAAYVSGAVVPVDGGMLNGLF
jgi:3-oxoacyl-[acyl-carrier protein] reductase